MLNNNNMTIELYNMPSHSSHFSHFSRILEEGERYMRERNRHQVKNVACAHVKPATLYLRP